MPRGHTVAVTIELRVGAEPIAGSLRVGGGPLTAFRGWLELTSLLQAAADNHQAPVLDAPDT